MNILIVDDEMVSRAKMRKIMAQEHDVHVAADGEEALELLKKQSIDLILLDIIMPGIDGFDVCARLKADTRTSDIPVIFLTAMYETENVTHGFDLGAVDFISKPVSPPILKARVSAHLALHSQKRILEEKVKERTVKLSSTREEVITMLGRASDFRDNETGLHVNRVSHYCSAIARAAGMNQDFIQRISLASPLHDVGKIGIPDSILLKPGKLTPEEFEVIKTHCAIGADILKGSKWDVINMAHVIALTHHEKWNGMGYPEGLKGEAIPMEGRISAIADVFDAVSTKRPYKDPWPLQKCIDLINSQAGEHFDSRLVEAFNSVLSEIKNIAMNMADDVK